MARTLVAVGAGFLLLLPLGLAAPTDFGGAVRDGDEDVGSPLIIYGGARLGFFDADGDQQADPSADEAVYFDIDGSGTVGLGDLRLTPFYRYDAGSGVMTSNRDHATRLFLTNAWFAQAADGAWFADMDDNRAASPGDVRLSGDGYGTKIQPGDSVLGTSLVRVQDEMSTPNRVGWVDADGDGVRDESERVYLNVGQPSFQEPRVDPGDVRVSTVGMAADNEPTRREFNFAFGLLAWLGMGLLVAIFVVAWFVNRQGRRPAEPSGPEGFTRGGSGPA